MSRDPTAKTFKLLGATELFGVGFVNASLYGIAFTLYCFTAHLSYLRLRDPHRRRQSIISLVQTTLVMTCVLISFSFDAWRYRLAYIDHGDSPGNGYRYEYIATSLPLSIAASSLSFVAVDCFTQAIQIWRLWVIWNTSQYAIYIIIAPSLAWLAFIGIQIAVAVFDFHGELGPDNFDLTLIPALMALSFFITMVVATCIIGRIALVRRQHLKIMGPSENSRQYTTIITMLVESFALDAVWTTAAIIITALSDEKSPALFAARQFITGTTYSIRLIAYFLVVYRVSANRGWEKQTEKRLTTLQWNHDAPQTTEVDTYPTSYPEWSSSDGQGNVGRASEV